MERILNHSQAKIQSAFDKMERIYILDNFKDEEKLFRPPDIPKST